MQITIIKKKNYKNFTLIYKNQKMGKREITLIARN